jgi:CubicO group peptidase (beta-lactamase class C family)
MSGLRAGLFLTATVGAAMVVRPGDAPGLLGAKRAQGSPSQRYEVGRQAQSTPHTVSPVKESETSDQRLAMALEEFAGRLEGTGFSGALLVAQNGKILLSRGYGFADRARRVRNTPDTVLPIGSITKQFTAAAILRLEMDGKLKTTDLLAKYFPETPSDKQAITLHHLLTHSSGLDDSVGPDEEPLSREGLVKRALDSKLNWEPGKKYLYSNTGYSLLAAIVEMVSEKPWEQYLREKLFLPVGMTKTGCMLPNWDPDTIPHGYNGQEDRGTFESVFGPDGPYWNLKGNGGIASTIGDMYRWHLALLGEKILSAAAKQKAFTPYVREGDNAESFYGYGWALFKTPRGTNLITHNGGDGTFTAEMLRYIDEGVVIYGASNEASAPIWEATGQLGQIVFGTEPAPVPPPPVKATNHASLASVEGSYRLPSGARFRISVGDNRLIVTPESQEGVEVLASMREAHQKRMADALQRTAELLQTEATSAAARGTPLACPACAGAKAAGPADVDLRNELTLKLGPIKRTNALCAIRGPEGRAVVLVRFAFEKGEQLARYVWTADLDFLGARPVTAPAGLTAFPETESHFFTYDSASGGVRRFSAVTSRAGRVEAIEIDEPNGIIRAIRED